MDGDVGVRVSDADRERAAQRLARAQGEGRLGLGEFDERVRAAYGATTRADLAPLTADLPEEVRAGRTPTPVEVGDRRRSPRRRGAAVGTWAVVSALNLALWVVVSLAASDPVHPWWIWVAGPWGVLLAYGLLAEHSGARRVLPTPVLPVPGWGCGARRRR